MDQFVNWFPKNAHWLAILGMIFAVLGAIYNAYAVDGKGEFLGGRKHGGMTRGLTFGLVGGITVAIGLGTIGLLLLLLEVVLRPQVLVEGAPTDNPLLSVVAYTLIGAVLGVIFGLLYFIIWMFKIIILMNQSFSRMCHGMPEVLPVLFFQLKVS